MEITMRSYLFRVTLLPLIRRWRQPEKISSQQLQDMLTGQEPPVVLDVRNPDEFTGELGHIAGAILIPLPDLEKRLDELPSQRTQTIVTV